MAGSLVYSRSGGAFVICFLCGQAAQVLVVLQFGGAGQWLEQERGCCRECGELLVDRLSQRPGRRRGRLFNLWLQPSLFEAT